MATQFNVLDDEDNDDDFIISQSEPEAEDDSFFLENEKKDIAPVPPKEPSLEEEEEKEEKKKPVQAETVKAPQPVQKKEEPVTEEIQDINLKRGTTLFEMMHTKSGWDGDYDFKETFEKDYKKYAEKGIEGFIEYTVELNNRAYQQGAQEVLADPELEALYQFKKAGGTASAFYEKYYSLSTLDTKSDREIVEMDLKSRGYSEDEIEDMADSFEKDGSIRKRATKAKQTMVESRKRQEEADIAAYKKQQEVQEAENKRFQQELWTKLQTVKEVGGISVPSNFPNKVFEQAILTDKNGYTALQRAMMDEKNWLTVNLLMSHDFSIEKAAAKKIAAEKKQAKLDFFDGLDNSNSYAGQSTGKKRQEVSANGFGNPWAK